MEPFFQMHVFFFVTTIAVIVLAILVAWGLIYLVRILRNVDKLSEAAAEESTLLRADIAELRSNVRKEGSKLKHFTDFGKKFAGRMTRKPARPGKKESEE